MLRKILDSDLMKQSKEMGLNDLFAQKYVEMNEELYTWRDDCGTFYEWNDTIYRERMRDIKGNAQNLRTIALVTEHNDWDEFYDQEER